MAFEEKFDQVSKLINLGKQKGYLLYDEVNDLLPSDVHSAEELEDYRVNLDGAAILELRVNPDVSGRTAFASLDQLRIA